MPPLYDSLVVNFNSSSSAPGRTFGVSVEGILKDYSADNSTSVCKPQHSEPLELQRMSHSSITPKINLDPGFVHIIASVPIPYPTGTGPTKFGHYKHVQKRALVRTPKIWWTETRIYTGMRGLGLCLETGSQTHGCTCIYLHVVTNFTLIQNPLPYNPI